MDLKVDISRCKEVVKDIAVEMDGVKKSLERLYSGKEDFTGWVGLPKVVDKGEIEAVVEAAEEIKKKCELLIVIGIGGSYLGARAAIEALSDQGREKCGVSVKFAGNNLSAVYHAPLLEEMKNKETCLCVISKSGTTTEPSIAFAVFKEALYDKYGKNASQRIYAITDEKKGVLREEADKMGYKTFVVPDDIGGRYSVLTPVGLLPIAAAGIDIVAMLDGARIAAEADWSKEASEYAITRYKLMRSGKSIEIFEYYEPQLQYFAEWLKQLFGESEGKEGKGLFPASLSFSADLHSMGQFLQEGSPVFFETVLNIEKPKRDIIVPQAAGPPFAGMSMNKVNQAALCGVMAAHETAGVPIVKIDIPSLTPCCFGQMIYFFQMTCAITGYLIGVNPFDQPGVESYKAEMKKELQKSEYTKA